MNQRRGKHLFVGPLSKESAGFSIYQVDSGMIALDYVDAKEANKARKVLLKVTGAVSVPTDDLFEAIIGAVTEAQTSPVRVVEATP